MATSTYRHIDVKAYAEIDGVRVEIVSVTVRYAINAIPTATVILAVGRNATAAATSKAANIYAKQAYRSPIKILANYANKGYFTLFRGYVSDVSVKKSSSMFGVAIGAVSWFNDLNAGTPFSSGLTAAATLYDLNVPIAGSTGLTTQNGGPANSVLSLRQTIKSQLSDGNVGDAIKNTALALTGGGDIGGNTALYADISNEYAATALNATTVDLVSALPDIAIVSDGFASAIANSFFTTFSGSTLWNALVAMTVSMGYVIIPLIEKMYIMPWTPILSEPATTFSSATIAATNNNFRVATNIKTMLIYNTDSMVTYSLLAGSTKVPGLFTNDSMESGMTDMAPAPRWLKDILGADSSEYTMTVDEGIRSRAPQTGGTDVEFSVDDNIVAALSDLTTSAGRYAKFMYALQALGNVCTIMGAPQGNIIPGMNLRFSLGDDVGKMDGFVNAVVYNIDSEHHSTDMSVELSQVRAPADSGALGMDSGVMWKGIVGGGSIVANTITPAGSGTEEGV